MAPIIAIVGRSGSGKTTLLEKLIPEFKTRGYRVGTVKHHRHDFAIDHQGKDSWRHAQAGADTVVIASPDKLALVKRLDAEMPLEEMRKICFQDVDVILAEGYKTLAAPKIEVFRSTIHAHPLCTHDEHLVAVVSDSPLQLGVPRFGLEEVVPLVDFLEHIVA